MHTPVPRDRTLLFVQSRGRDHAACGSPALPQAEDKQVSAPWLRGDLTANQARLWARHRFPQYEASASGGAGVLFAEPCSAINVHSCIKI